MDSQYLYLILEIYRRLSQIRAGSKMTNEIEAWVGLAQLCQHNFDANG